MFGVDSFTVPKLTNMFFVGLGVVIASAGCKILPRNLFASSHPGFLPDPPPPPPPSFLSPSAKHILRPCLLIQLADTHYSGEIEFVTVGVVFQLASMVMESCRLTLVQILLQRRGLKLNPVTTLYYVAPCCCFFLTPLFLFMEVSSIAGTSMSNAPTGRTVLRSPYPLEPPPPPPPFPRANAPSRDMPLYHSLSVAQHMHSIMLS